MHELGTVVYIIDTVDKLAVENHLTKIGSVTLEVGEVSGIIPSYLSDFWLYARKKSDFLKEAELKIETLPAVTFCQDCKQTYPRCSTPRSARTATARTPSSSPAMSTPSKR